MAFWFGIRQSLCLTKITVINKTKCISSAFLCKGKHIFENTLFFKEINSFFTILLDRSVHSANLLPDNNGIGKDTSYQPFWKEAGSFQESVHKPGKKGE